VTGRTARRTTIALGLVFSYPAFRTWSDGAIELDTFAIRVAVAMVVAYLAVSAIGMLVGAYTADELEPAAAARGDDPDGEIEDAVVVEPPDAQPG
jgi:hypothetical protein